MPKHLEILNGQITCERCSKTFTWLHQYKDSNYKQPFEAIIMLTPETLKAGESILSQYDQDTGIATVYCPHKGIHQEECGQPNRFELTI